jgi:Cdc6-like AAA superfamily ATPase
MRFFNTEGPVRSADHYCLPPLSRWDLDEVLALIDRKKYFLLHAPRQTGKTSCLLALMEHLNREGRYLTVYANLETAQPARENVALAMADIVQTIAEAAARQSQDASLPGLAREVLAESAATRALRQFLTRSCERVRQPVVLLLDEVDALVGDTLIALLRQLRAGDTERPAAFPQTVILCGVRDLRDYRIHASSESAPISGGSAFLP